MSQESFFPLIMFTFMAVKPCKKNTRFTGTMALFILDTEAVGRRGMPNKAKYITRQSADVAKWIITGLHTLPRSV